MIIEEDSTFLDLFSGGDKLQLNTTPEYDMDNRQAIKAQDYSHEFNKAAYQLRGLNYASNRDEETFAAVQRMVEHFHPQYVRMMDLGIAPALAAEILTDQWWDHLSNKVLTNSC